MTLVAGRKWFEYFKRFYILPRQVLRTVPAFLTLIVTLSACRETSLNLVQLSKTEIDQVKVILQKLAPLIEHNEKDKTLATLSFDELYAPLDPEEKKFLQFFQTFDPIKADIKTKWHGIADGKEDLVRLDDQVILKNGKTKALSPQFVPRKTYESYQRMNLAMQQDLGKKLLVESGYRSSPYQLYLFILYLGNHHYSILETAQWNAFPGYSEHGDPKHQALDFINGEGINGEDHPEDFAKLPEFAWLEAHGAEYGFFLSFPKQSEEGIAYEPWHWRYEERLDPKQ